MTDSPAAPDRSLTAQPWREDIANAHQTAGAMAEIYAARLGLPPSHETEAAFERIARLLETALVKLDTQRAPDDTEVAPARTYSDPAGDLGMQTDRGHPSAKLYGASGPPNPAVSR